MVCKNKVVHCCYSCNGLGICQHVTKVMFSPLTQLQCHFNAMTGRTPSGRYKEYVTYYILVFHMQIFTFNNKEFGVK